MQQKWLFWAKQLQSIAQAGIEYTTNPFDKERYEMIRSLSIEILREHTEIDSTRLKNLFANETGYQTPKIDVRAAIFNQDNEILMVKENHDSKWSLPGGWADIELSLYQNTIKEAKEEAGADIKPKRIIAILDRNKHINDDFPYSVYKIFVECDLIKTEFSHNIETLEYGFFKSKSLPELSEGRNTKKQIDLCFRARKEKVFETIFD
jgi:ADP-ribose pyrophosphatase YjhB (NUDIX family)